MAEEAPAVVAENKGPVLAPDMDKELRKHLKAAGFEEVYDLGMFLSQNPDARKGFLGALRHSRIAKGELNGDNTLVHYWSSGWAQKGVVIVGGVATATVAGVLIWQGVALIVGAQGPFSRLFGGASE